MDEAARRESELVNLLSAVWDDRLDAPSRTRLEELLAQDDYADIDLLTELTKLHLDLEWLVSSNAAQEKAIASLRNVCAAKQRKSIRLPDWRLAGFGGLAAAVLLWIAFTWYFAPHGHEYLERPPQPVGQVTRLVNPEWTAGSGPRIGDTLKEGEIVDIKKGRAQLSMGFGADVLLEGPCRVRIEEQDRVTLEQGQLAVRAAKWAVGFTVDTEDLVVTDLGTWFSMRTGGEGPSEIHVLEGAVLATQLNEATSNDPGRRLKADQAVQMSTDGAFQLIKFRHDAATDELNRFGPLRPIRIWNSGIGLREGDEDPHWNVTAGGVGRMGRLAQPAIVSAPHGSYGVNEAKRSQWISVENGTSSGVPARSQYTFETEFDLTGFDLPSVWVSGLVLADDGVDEVWLNGKQLDIAPWKDWGYGVVYNRFHPIDIRSGFVPGTNRLSIVVKNERFIFRSDRGFDLPETPNPMALRTEWQAFGRPARSSPDE
jgi:hypothetical protein